ncbi:hypothetical protein EZS27_021468 [termite gut metagenome]|uniref:Helix-turn-helix domain-containing protein n=1 Tax=termite gut metagenome TaxID=433724 RepID=A0A5J4R6I1_9ZZZZ
MNQLLKSSTNTEIKTYFNEVLRLANSDKEFPVDLDEVWALVYGRKSDSVESLKKDFIQDVDFQALRKNPQRGASSPINYYLSIPCFEFFIARKVRPVFEVYRQVFHHATKNELYNLATRNKPIPVPKYSPLIELAKQCPDVNITFKAGELIEVIDYCINKTRKELEQLINDANTETYPSADKTAKILDVNRSTLWRWQKRGYLVPIEIGGKRRYKMSDINKILNKR